MSDWLVEDELGTDELNRARLVGESVLPPPPPITAPIALRLHDLLIHDNKKWSSFLGGADVRVDLLVVQGNMLDESDPHSFYTPTTVRFEDVGDESTLPIDEHGLLAYYGWPKHFLDLSVLVSRDTKHEDDLVALLEASSAEIASASSSIVSLAVAGPAGLALNGAFSAAASLAALAYKVLRKASKQTIGVYRGNRLENPHRFGFGPNPADGSAYRRGDLSFRYDVISG